MFCAYVLINIIRKYKSIYISYLLMIHNVFFGFVPKQRWMTFFPSLHYTKMFSDGKMKNHSEFLDTQDQKRVEIKRKGKRLLIWKVKPFSKVLSDTWMKVFWQNPFSWNSLKMCWLYFIHPIYNWIFKIKLANFLYCINDLLTKNFRIVCFSLIFNRNLITILQT